MEPFLEWDLKLLPLVMSWWFDKARGYYSADQTSELIRVDKRKLSSIYQFARAVPMMFVPSPKKKEGGTKRKMSESDR